MNKLKRKILRKQLRKNKTVMENAAWRLKSLGLYQDANIARCDACNSLYIDGDISNIPEISYVQEVMPHDNIFCKMVQEMHVLENAGYIRVMLDGLTFHRIIHTTNRCEDRNSEYLFAEEIGYRYPNMCRIFRIKRGRISCDYLLIDPRMIDLLKTAAIISNITCVSDFDIRDKMLHAISYMCTSD